MAEAGKLAEVHLWQAEIAFLSEAGHHLRDRDQRIAQLEARVAEQDQQAT